MYLVPVDFIKKFFPTLNTPKIHEAYHSNTTKVK